MLSGQKQMLGYVFSCVNLIIVLKPGGYGSSDKANRVGQRFYRDILPKPTSHLLLWKMSPDCSLVCHCYIPALIVAHNEIQNMKWMPIKNVKWLVWPKQ